MAILKKVSNWLTGGYNLPPAPRPATGAFMAPENQPYNSYAFPPSDYNIPSSLSGNYNIPSSSSGNYGHTTSSTQGQNPTTNFTTELMKLLKDAQVQQQAGQAGLMKQQQDITGTGLDLANTINTQNIEQLNPEDIVGLRRGAIGAVQPGELSVENQIKLSNAGFENINQLVEMTLGSYEKEQDRYQQELDRQQRAREHSESLATSRASAMDYTEQERRRLEQEGLLNANRQIQLDFLYGEEEKTPISSEHYPTIARALVKQFSSLVSGYAQYGKDPIERAINFINEVGTIKINGKDVTLSSSQKQTLLDSISSQYPGGRTFGQRLIPGGR